jgi:RimJ/RimL family protein N-acetyltransferase
MDSDLFTGKLVRLTAIHPETDAAVFARWGADIDYMRHLDSGPQLPDTAKKIKEAIEKEQGEASVTQLEFAVRPLADDQLIGFVAFDGISWQHGDTFVAIGIGDPAYRGKGYGTDAMQVMLRYGFMELNLHRISLDVFEYNERALKSYLKAGFVIEGRQRGMLRRDGRRWDFIYMGILRDEWSAMNNGQ